MKKLYKKSRRARKPNRPLKPTRKNIDATWDKLAKEVEAEEAEAKASAGTNKPHTSSEVSKKSKRKKPDVNSAVRKIFKEKTPSGDKEQGVGGTPGIKMAKSKSIDYGKTLKSCTTVEEAAGFLAKTHERFTNKAQRAVGRRKISDASRSVLDGLLTKPEATSVCIMTNPRLVADAFEHLLKGLVDASKAEPPIEMAFVTLISGDCETSSDRPVMDLHRAQKRARDTLRAMSPNFIAMTELAMFNSIPHLDGGITLNHHEHAVIFGDLSKVQRIVNRDRKKYSPNSTEAQSIHIKPITDVSEENLARVAAYLLKAPDKAINYRPPIGDKKAFVNKSEKGDRMIRFLRMAQSRSMLTFEDCFYAGGEGGKIKKKLFDVLRALSKSDASPSKMLIHPDAIPAFWADLAKELGRDRWALPVIKRRP